MDVVSSRILLRPSDLDRGRRPTVTCGSWPYALSSARRMIPGWRSSPARGGRGLRARSRPAQVLGDEPDPGPRCSRRARPARRGRNPGCAGTSGGALGPDRDAGRGPPTASGSTWPRFPPVTPLRRDPRPARPPERRTVCRITARSTETRQPSADLVGGVTGRPAAGSGFFPCNNVARRLPCSRMHTCLR